MSKSETLKNNPGYRAYIDGLRAIAVLAVVIFHLSPSRLSGGYVGVDIFFVISGYLISKNILAQLEKNEFSLLDFYVRRINRIVPSLLTILTFLLLVGWVVYQPNDYKQLLKHISGGVTFISNFLLWGESGYFDTLSNRKPLLHLWSLSLEAQIYLTLPLIAMMATRHRISMFLTIATLGTSSFVACILEMDHDASMSFYFPHTRAWEFLLGGAVAQFQSKYPFKKTIKGFGDSNGRPKILTGCTLIRKFSTEIFQIFGIIVICLCFLFYDGQLDYPGVLALLPVLASSIVILGGATTSISRYVLSARPLVWLGRISYPLFLWHWPLLVILKSVKGDELGRLDRFLCLALSIIFAFLTYNLIEQPIRQSRSSKFTSFILLLLSAMVVGSGFIGYQRNGFPYRSHITPVANVIHSDPEKRKKCLLYYGIYSNDIRYCELSLFENRKPNIALIGDSHAASLFHGMSKELAERGKGLVMLGGRLFTNVSSYPNGSDHEIIVSNGGALATNFVAKESSIDTVIMVTRGPGYILDKNWQFFLTNQPHVIDRYQVFESGLREALSLMEKFNKRVVLVLDNPETTFNINDCLPSKLSGYPIRPDCTITRSTFDSRHGPYRDLILRVVKDYPSTIVFDQAAYLCNLNTCTFKDGDTLLFSDSHHLSGAGSEFMAGKLISLLFGASPKILK